MIRPEQHYDATTPIAGSCLDRGRCWPVPALLGAYALSHEFSQVVIFRYWNERSPRCAPVGVFALEEQQHKSEAPWSRGVAQNRKRKKGLVVASYAQHISRVEFRTIPWEDYEIAHVRRLERGREKKKKEKEGASWERSFWQADHLVTVTLHIRC